MNSALARIPKIHQEYSPQNTYSTPTLNFSKISIIPELIKSSHFKNN